MIIDTEKIDEFEIEIKKMRIAVIGAASLLKQMDNNVFYEGAGEGLEMQMLSLVDKYDEVMKEN